MRPHRVNLPGGGAERRPGENGAAFFDLDRTLMEGSSAFQFARAAYKSGVIKRSELLRDALENVRFRLHGSTDESTEVVRERIGRALREVRVRDMQRRRTVRGRILAWLPSRDAEDDGEEFDPIAQAPSHEATPARRLELDEAMGVLETAVADLPQRQQQAFLLRNLEGMDVAQTAAAMGCSEGSVKTHYFRALENLRARLGDVF